MIVEAIDTTKTYSVELKNETYTLISTYNHNSDYTKYEVVNLSDEPATPAIKRTIVSGFILNESKLQ